MTAATVREQRLHAMTSAEEHVAMRWLADHEPDTFDRAAAVVEKVRRLDGGDVRKESRDDPER
jgi:hypothetical protein